MLLQTLDDDSWAAYILQKGRELGFKFDGCTRVPDLNVRTCCDIHDFDYQSLMKTRLEVDNAFGACMLRKAANNPNIIGKLAGVGVAITYWFGVRIFGSLYWKRKQNVELGKILHDDLGPIGLDRL